MSGAGFLGRWPRWLNWWTAACFPSVIVAALTLGLVTTLYLIGAICFLIVLVFIGLRGEIKLLDDVGAGAGAGATLRTKVIGIVRVSLCAVSIFFTLTTVGQWFGPAWIYLGAAMALTSPPGIQALRRAAFATRRWFPPANSRTEIGEPRSGSASASPEDPSTFTDPKIDGLTDIELCLLWRHTFWDLTSADSPAHWAQITLLREEILDELSRRNGSAIDAWLASEPRASGSPERFFRGDDNGQAAAA